jgi:hypothetical protein
VTDEARRWRRHRPAPAPPAAGSTLGRWVALVDERPCSLTAVTEALARCRASGAPLQVVLVNYRSLRLAALSAWGLLPSGSLTDLDDALESVVFHDVAGLVAPTGTAWTFSTARHPAELPDLCRPAAPSDPGSPGPRLVVTRHSRRRRSRLVVAAASLAAGPGVDGLTVLRCEHAARDRRSAAGPAGTPGGEPAGGGV